MKALMAAVALLALPATAFAATSERDVLSHYADLAHAEVRGLVDRSPRLCRAR